MTRRRDVQQSHQSTAVSGLLPRKQVIVGKSQKTGVDCCHCCSENPSPHLRKEQILNPELRIVPAPGLEPLPPDLDDAIVGALASALVLEYLQDREPTVQSPQGRNRVLDEDEPAAA